MRSNFSNVSRTSPRIRRFAENDSASELAARFVKRNRGKTEAAPLVLKLCVINSFEGESHCLISRGSPVRVWPGAPPLYFSIIWRFDGSELCFLFHQSSTYRRRYRRPGSTDCRFKSPMPADTQVPMIGQLLAIIASQGKVAWEHIAK
jgi:hypothetical protein